MKNLLLIISFVLMHGQLEAQTEDPKALLFNVTDLEGQHYKLQQLKGKVVVLNFWFIQCKPCVMEIPELNHLVEKYKDQEVVFLALAINGKKDLKTFLQNNPYQYHIIPNSSQVIQNYGINLFPTHMIIDQEGRVSYQAMGLNPFTVKQLDEEIKKLAE